MPVHVAVLATARAGAAGARVATGAARTGATAVRAGAGAARSAATATRTAGSAARGAGRLGQSAARTGRDAARAGSRTSGQAHRLQRGVRRATNQDRTLRRVRRHLDRGGGDHRSRPGRPLGAGGGGGQSADPQGQDDQATRATDAGTHIRRGLRAAAVTAGAVRHPLRAVGRLASPRRWMGRGRGGKRKAGQGASRKRGGGARRWLIRGLIVFLVFGMISSSPLLLKDETDNASAATGATLTNADTMEEAFVEAGVPEEYADDFVATANMGIDPRLVAAVAWQESAHFDQDVIDCERDSRAGAKGIMQFMPDTASERGVDPCRPGEAITAGARYLLEIHGRVRTWDLALAGYNAGPNGVEDCGCIPQNGETEEYVPAVNDQWDEYKRTVPEPRYQGSLPSGSNPGGPLGSIERMVDGRITATMQALLDQAVPLFGRGKWIGCYRPGATDGSDGEHPLGRACDFAMSEPLNTHPSPEYLEHGWRLACWMVQNAEALKVRYVIWQELIWEGHDTAPDRRCQANRPAAGWGDYNRYDSCNPGRGEECLRLRHYDHVHVSVN